MPTTPNSPSLQIHEIYTSIQGESTWAGVPTTFVRTTGCPVRCVYCDTTHAFYDGRRLSVAEICDELANKAPRHVCVTGGEPLAQKSTLHLLEALIGHGYLVSLETSGVRTLEGVPRPCKVVLDLKTPESGVFDSWLPANLAYLQPGDELKTVIMSENDWQWFLDWYSNHQGRIPENVVRSVSPCMPDVAPAQLSNWLLASGLNLRLNLQLHKLIWPGENRGR